MDMEELIRTITVQVLNMLYKRVLIFVTGGAVNIKDIFNTLKDFKYIKYSVVMSEAANEVIPKEYLEAINAEFLDSKVDISNAVKNSDIIMIPVMTKNTLAKSALGIRDTKLLAGISEAFIQGKKVISVKDSCNLVPCTAYSALFSTYIKNLESFGMEFIGSEELKKTMNRELKGPEKLKADDYRKCLSGVITRAELVLEKGVKEIEVKSGSVITPFAKDYLDSEGIKIKYIS